MEFQVDKVTITKEELSILSKHIVVRAVRNTIQSGLLNDILKGVGKNVETEVNKLFYNREVCILEVEKAEIEKLRM